jgi:uncharacterized membrane protein YccF (DUF307 family)
MAMVPKLIFAVFLLVFGAWLVIQPTRQTWAECVTVKGIICVPKVR